MALIRWIFFLCLWPILAIVGIFIAGVNTVDADNSANFDNIATWMWWTIGIGSYMIATIIADPAGKRAEEREKKRLKIQADMIADSLNKQND